MDYEVFEVFWLPAAWEDATKAEGEVDVPETPETGGENRGYGMEKLVACLAQQTRKTTDTYVNKRIRQRKRTKQERNVEGKLKNRCWESVTVPSCLLGWDGSSVVPSSP